MLHLSSKLRRYVTFIITFVHPFCCLAALVVLRILTYNHRFSPNCSVDVRCTYFAFCMGLGMKLVNLVKDFKWL
jgi:hypothetical protein